MSQFQVAISTMGNGALLVLSVAKNLWKISVICSPISSHLLLLIHTQILSLFQVELLP